MRLENPATPADHKGLKGFKHTVATLDEIQRRPYLTGNVLQVGYMVAAYPDDLQLVLAYTGGMAHLYHEQAPRGVGLVVISGSVNQWLDSCGRACCPESDLTVRFVFNRIYRHLETIIPRDMFTGDRRDNDDGTFLLEYK
jgi:hypothetical protein